jgi:HAE1 family hydrophobic/amphiphilic exporter-1/multidrug efflux pump
MSRYFIERPIFAAVLSIVLVLAGLVAMRILPIAQYPEIAPPTVTIVANYPGASAETLSRTVAAPIEEQLSGVENLLYFESSASSNGQVQITATFEVGTDVDKATFNINNRVLLAQPRLPDEVRRTGVQVAKRSTNFLVVIALNSPSRTRDTLFLSNYATLNVLDDLKRIPGVADVTIFGARDYSMRLWLDPDLMSRFGVTVADISAAVVGQNAQYAAGKIGAEPAPPGQSIAYTVTARGRLLEPEEFGEILLRASGPAGALRIKDVARVELGAQSYDASNFVDGQPAIALAVFLQSGANALDTGDAVKAAMQQLKTRFPEGVDYLIPYDTTLFVSASIHEVMVTIMEAAAIVLLVVFVFLQSWRATLIPMLAVPVSLIGTFAGLYIVGFSINTLTLFAMVLAIGIVVDDAIVVLENVERLIRVERMKPFDAAVEAMREVQGAVIGIVLSLSAVFIPVAFLGGLAGQLYRQFAVTVTIAVVLSGFVALTLTPSLAALLLKGAEDHKPTIGQRMFRPFNRFFDWVTRLYLKTTRLVLRFRWLSMLAFVAVFAGSWYLLQIIPGSFVPPEDQGYIIASVQLPDGATLERTGATTERLRGQMADNQALKNFFIVNGFDLLSNGSKSSAATIFIPMKDWGARQQTAEQMVQQVNGLGFGLPDGIAFAFNPPPIQGLGIAGGFEVYVQGRADPDPKRLARVTNEFMQALGKDPVISPQVQTFYRPTVPQLHVEVDRQKAISLGVSVNEVFLALQAQLGSLYVNDFNRSGRTYRVTMQADARFRSQPDDIGRLHVRSQTSGQMIPLSALLTSTPVIGAEQIQRFNGYIAAKVIGAAKAGFSSGEAITAVERVGREALPDGYSIEWTGQAFQEKRTGQASVFAFGFAIVMVYLILSAMYERWGVPLAVVMAVPFALIGALAAVWLRGRENDIYFQIGLVVLIGLAAKNAILIAEFAMQGMQEGKSAVDAALEAARLRFRPIVMTSLAFVFGVLPLSVATGAGAAARQSMGTGVVGGMIIATFVAPIFVPLFFSLLTRKPREEHGHRRTSEEIS